MNYKRYNKKDLIWISGSMDEKDAYIVRDGLLMKYSFKSIKVDRDDLFNYVYVVKLEFKNKADEAEFILRESK